MRINYLAAAIAFSPAWALPVAQDVIRPAVGHQGLAGFILGSAPDLIVGFCIPFSMLIVSSPWSRLTTHKVFWLWCAITAVGIFVDEYFAPIGPNVFDPNDLILGIVGIFLAILVFYLVPSFRKAAA